MNTVKECFNLILQGDKNNSCLAARSVRKILYSSHSGKKDYEEIKKLIVGAPNEYAKITEDWRRENFVRAISSIYFLHDRESQPDFLFPWLFQLLQHPNGVIRYAAVRMFDCETGPLTVHIRFSGKKSISYNELSPEEADKILYSLFTDLNNLLAGLWQPKYKKYKYVSSLPASPYKSAQMVLAELEDSCGQNTINRFIASMRLLNNEIDGQK